MSRRRANGEGSIWPRKTAATATRHTYSPQQARSRECRAMREATMTRGDC
jgi:hypothetical protein